MFYEIFKDLIRFHYYAAYALHKVVLVKDPCFFSEGKVFFHFLFLPFLKIKSQSKLRENEQDLLEMSDTDSTSVSESWFKQHISRRKKYPTYKFCRGGFYVSHTSHTSSHQTGSCCILYARYEKLNGIKNATPAFMHLLLSFPQKKTLFLLLPPPYL